MALSVNSKIAWCLCLAMVAPQQEVVVCVLVLLTSDPALFVYATHQRFAPFHYVIIEEVNLLYFKLYLDMSVYRYSRVFTDKVKPHLHVYSYVN